MSSILNRTLGILLNMGPPPSEPELTLRSPVPPEPLNLAQAPELNLKSALHRLFTFPADYLARTKVRPEDLAEAGFYMCSSYKCLCCAFCGKEICDLGGWCGLNQTQMIDEHRRLSPDCPMFQPDGPNVPLGNPVDFTLEAHRLFSLLRDEKGALWKHVSPYDLARSGFYYAGEQDCVRCEFCKLEVRGWEAGDTALGEHARGNPGCPFLRNHPLVRNVKLGHEEDSNSSVPAALDEPQFSELWQVESRVATFNNAWPKILCQVQRPRRLAKAGLFYTGMSDRVQCFMCGTELKDWEAGHNPWDRHFGANDSCAFLLMTRGPSSSIVSSSSGSVASNQQDYEERTPGAGTSRNPSTCPASLPQSVLSRRTRADSEVSSSSEDEPERQRRRQWSAGAVPPAVPEEVIPDICLDAERQIPPQPAEPVPVYEPEDPYPVLMTAGHQRRTSNKVVRGPTGAVPDFQGF